MTLINDRPTKIDRIKLEGAIIHLREQINKRMKEKGPGALVSSHEILGLMTEEYQELVIAVTAKPPNLLKVRKELLDIAVVSILGVACVDLDTLDW